jgi:hypothetical protein
LAAEAQGKRRAVKPDGAKMTAIVLISFAITVVCFLLAIDWAFYQQLLLVLAAASAIILVCALEAWDGHDRPASSENERRHSISTDD